MKQHLLPAIAVLAAIILALFSFDTANSPYPARSYRAYGYNPAPSAWNGSGDGTLSVLQEDNTGCIVAPLTEADAVSGSFPTLPEAGSPSVAPPATLPLAAMSELAPVQLPPLDAGMVNVTGGPDGNGQTAGYRVIPRPGEFAVAVPYDPELLPQGFTEDDIRTYVYDRQYQRWVAIQRDSVNETLQLICSRYRPWEKGLPHTQNDLANPQDALAQVRDMMSFAPQGEGSGDSPLDFINAVLKTPEMPETSAYTPTSIKELKAADPLEGLTLMQPPTANSSGTANLSYPIEIPAGRQGMQPNLALTYSSGGGNGWLGVGWDIYIPSITVETRWGVPRYDAAFESEVYVYEGEQLVTRDGSGNFRAMPHRTNQWTSRSTLGSEERFYPRRNEAFDSIVRHGTGPDNYWWSVTHRNGVTDYYGKSFGSESVDLHSVLCDPVTHNIAQWMLTESRDQYGNWVRYSYVKESHPSVIHTSLNEGTQVYPERIVYSGFDTTSGKYSIRFNRDEGRRDIITNARYGFREVTASTLCNIEVVFDGEVLRRYYFVTENKRESGYKTRLTDMVRMDPPIGDVECGNILDPDLWSDDSGESDMEGSFGKQDLVRYNFDYYDYPEANSIFGDAVEIRNLSNDFIRSSFDDGEHEATALGATSGKDWSVGGTVCLGLGSNVSSSNNSVGGNFTYSRSRSKGLLTMVDLDGDGRADKVYKRNNKVCYRKNISDDEYHFHFGDEVELEGVSDFLDVVGNTPSFGVQGHFVDFNVNGSMPISVSYTKVYFSDVNGDGLPDIVTDDGVLFNNIDDRGNVYFASFQALAGPSPSDPEEDSFVMTSSFAGCDGGIIYDGAVNGNLSCDMDYGYVTIPTNMKELFQEIESLQQDGYSIVDYTDTSITYRFSDTLHDIISCTPADNEPDLDAVKVWIAPCTGTVRLTSETSLIQGDSETERQSRHRNGVVTSIQHNEVIAVSGRCLSSSNAPVVLCRDTIPSGDAELHLFDTTLNVTEGDAIFFRLQSMGNRTADKVNSSQHIEYTSPSVCEGTQYDSDDDFVLTGDSYFRAPKQGQVTISGTLVRRRNSLSSPCSLRVVKNESIVVTSERPINTLRSTEDYSCSIPVNAGDTIRIFIVPTGSSMDWSSVSFRPRLEFMDDLSDHTLAMGDPIYGYPPTIMNIDGERPELSPWFGSLYKGWGQFAYNNNFPNSEHLPIDVGRLVLPAILFDDTTDFNHATFASTINSGNYQVDIAGGEPSANADAETLAQDIDNLYNPLSAGTSWVAMHPNGEYGAYMGFGNTTAIFADQTHNTRQPVIIPLEADENENDYDEYGNLVEEIPEYDDVIPQNGSNGSVKTIRKESVSVMGNFGAGISSGANMSISLSVGENKVTSDFLDLNGDRYPDLLVRNTAQYTMPWGGLGDNTYAVGAERHACKSLVYSAGTTAGGGYPDPYRKEGQNPPKNEMVLRGASLSGSMVSGEDETRSQYVDINGDGLPDQVRLHDGKVALNTGYGFQTTEPWNIPVLRNGGSVSYSLSGGFSFSYNQYSIGGGTGSSQSDNYGEAVLMDFNGDGLPDMVKPLSQNLYVNYNYGNGQWTTPAEVIPQVSDISRSSTVSKSSSIDLTVGFSTSFAKMTVGAQVSPSNKSFSRDEVQLTDINGDGYPDLVTSDHETRLVIRYNTAAKTNLLKTVTNFTGSTVSLDYEMPMSSYEKPHRSWNLSSVEVRDPASPLGGNRTLTRFGYGKPYYDRYERMDYGYDTVVAMEYDTDNGDTLYRYRTDVYENMNYAKRGRKTYDCLYDAAGRKQIEHLYDAILYHWDGTIDDGNCSAADLYVGEEHIETNFYEGLSSPQITKFERREFDNRRNIINYTHWGNTSTSGEFFTVEVQYATGMGFNMVSLPVRVEVRDVNNNLLRRKTASYTNLGGLARTVLYNSTQISCFDFHYDQYGNVDTVWNPSNATGQRLTFSYEYDTIVRTYPTRIVNGSLGFASYADYDYRFGKPTRTIDINGNEMRYRYDDIGRLTHVVAPYEIDSLLAHPDFFTIRFDYTAHHYGVLDIFRYDPLHPLLSRASTMHFDVQRPDTSICTHAVVDNLGRPVQTRKDSEWNGHKVQLVSGRTEYDCFGRLRRMYHPFIDSTQDVGYNPYADLSTQTSYEYDMMDRKTRVVLPTHDTTRVEYGFDTHGGVTCFSTTTTDALNNAVTVLKGTLGQQLKQVAPYGTTTLFEYDCLGQLKKSTDPDGFETFYDYDQLGQMIHRSHPDAGDDLYEYDPAGNPVWHVNGNGDTVRYMFHYNQLTDMLHSRYPENDVHYRYGEQGAVANRAGRIMFQEDASGWQTFSYGKLGEVTENIRTFALPFEPKPYTFRMKYKYDSFNRMQQMTYPDGEKVSYGYNLGGMLNDIKGDKNGQTYPYVNHIAYNQYELKDSVLYGNGTLATYEYDMLMRLKTLQSYTGTSPAELMQDIYYDYDAVSNITHIVNQATMLGCGLGGTYKSSYTYDNLYRLSSAGGNWDNGTMTNTYVLSMGYHPNGRIAKKLLQADILDHLGNVTTKNYDNLYSYPIGKNTLEQTLDRNNLQIQTFGWDQAGNMTKHRLQTECTRWLCWDEENRLQGVADCNYASLYQYDANGERTYKLTGQYRYQNINGRYFPYAVLDNPTLYASPYVVCTPKGYTKHYYAESERVASKIGNGCLQDLCKSINAYADFNRKNLLANSYLLDCNSENDTLKKKLERNYLYGKKVMKCPSDGNFIVESQLGKLYKLIDCINEKEKECYWYHPDHLGSSSWITDVNGKPVQHLHYLPWGEDFVDQRSTNWNAIHAFSAKERDTETGLSYFGARYYSSDLCIWLSVDPMSDKYPHESNYVYCGDNPIILKDPNGREKINAFGKHYKSHSDACNRYKDNVPVIHLWAHGNSKMLQTFNPKTDNPQFVNNADDMHNFLCDHSSIYQNNSDKSNTSILVLHSCQTGKGEDNIAQQISSKLDLLVVAPSENVYNSIQNEGTEQEFTCEIGVNSTYIDKNGRKQVGKRGSWNIYYKGVMVDSFDGHSKPNFKDPQKTIEKYEKKYQQIMSAD